MPAHPHLRPTGSRRRRRPSSPEERSSSSLGRITPPLPGRRRATAAAASWTAAALLVRCALLLWVPRHGHHGAAAAAFVVRPAAGSVAKVPLPRRRGSASVGPSFGSVGDDAGRDRGESSQDSSDNSDQFFYNDFGDQVIGSGDGFGAESSGISRRGGGLPSPPRSLSSALADRIEASRQRARENWKRGNWEARGFRLDPDPPLESLLSPSGETTQSDDNSNELPRVHVCLVAADPHEPTRLWVGRTDGSLLAVQLGDEYLTTFRSQLTATLDKTTGAAKVATALVNAQETAIESAASNDCESTGDLARGEGSGPETTPFELECQGSVPGGQPVSKVAVWRPSPASPSILLAACDGSCDIQQLRIHEEDDNEGDAPPARLEPIRTLRGAHSTGSDVVLLRTVSIGSPQEASEPKSTAVLLSVANDGTLALWDLAQDGQLLCHCQLASDPDGSTGDDASTVSPLICSAACNDRLLFLGTREGRVLVYAVQDFLRLIKAPSDNGPPPIPSGQWAASQLDAVTALACAGPGALGQGGPTPSVTLLTGDRSGAVKQWEVLSRTTAEPDAGGQALTMRVEQWPKLATQRLQQRAHAFQSLHTAAVTAFLPVDDAAFLSASMDGSIVAWNPATGKPHFFLDGFEPAIRSLCLQDNTLITDGMKDLVCVHDFNIEPPEDDADDDGWDFDFGEVQ